MPGLTQPPIEPKYVDLMRALAQGIDGIVNPDSEKKETGFLLMLFPLEGHAGRCNYISNAERSDVQVLLREQLARFEGRMVDEAGRG